MFEKPSTMMTQDTWTNLVDPSPPMPTSSHVGWDGRSELFEGQIFFSKLEVKNTVKKYSMDRNYVAKTEQSTTRLLVYKCGNQNPCSWRLRAIRKPDQDVWKITRYAGPHSCLAFNVTTDHQILDARYIANMIMSTVEADPTTNRRTGKSFEGKGELANHIGHFGASGAFLMKRMSLKRMMMSLKRTTK
ncbi:hypothetical protein RHGRI_021176 [Rhododendron griersonianum]|uniref:Transposase MuDR plant domain-containing protein n=1 Tax=Rhododendron griersonianum TaxID=479676 RepID=A0AAV6JPJ7_9ERIC|nr:hypothetical protein RHGRI_021176 [Rhododendron griersonianum]